MEIQEVEIEAQVTPQRRRELELEPQVSPQLDTKKRKKTSHCFIISWIFNNPKKAASVIVFLLELLLIVLGFLHLYRLVPSMFAVVFSGVLLITTICTLKRRPSKIKEDLVNRLEWLELTMCSAQYASASAEFFMTVQKLDRYKVSWFSLAFAWVMMYFTFKNEGRDSEEVAAAKEYEDQIKELNEKLSIALSELTTQENLAEEAVSDWEKAKAEILALKDDLKSAENLAEEAVSDREKAKAETLQLKGHLQSAEDRAIHLDFSLKEHKLKLQEAKESNNSLAKRVHELENQLDLLRGKKEKLENDLEVERKNHEDDISRCKGFQEQAQKLEIELDLLCAKKETLENELENERSHDHEQGTSCTNSSSDSVDISSAHGPASQQIHP